MTTRRQIVITVLIVLLISIGFILYKSYDSNGIRTSVEVGDTKEQKEQSRKALEQIEEKLRDAEQRNASNSEKTQLYMDLGATLYSLGRLADAKVAYERAIEIDSNTGDAYVGLFRVLQTMRDDNAAKTAIIKAVEVKPYDWNLWRSYIAFARYQLKLNNAELKQIYEEALIRTNQNINIITVYGAFLEEIGDITASNVMWHKAIEIDPGNKAIYEAQMEK